VAGALRLHMWVDPESDTPTHVELRSPRCGVIAGAWPQVLVPMRNGMSEIHDLAAEDQAVLMGEMTKAALAVKVRLDAPPSLHTGPSTYTVSRVWSCGARR